MLVVVNCVDGCSTVVRRVQRRTVITMLVVVAHCFKKGRARWIIDIITSPKTAIFHQLIAFTQWLAGQDRQTKAARAGALLPLLLLPHTAGRGAEQKNEKKKGSSSIIYIIYITYWDCIDEEEEEDKFDKFLSLSFVLYSYIYFLSCDFHSAGMGNFNPLDRIVCPLYTL